MIQDKGATDFILQAQTNVKAEYDVRARMTYAASDDSHRTAERNEMTSPTRDEIDARLETIETRMDGRIATMEAKLDAKFSQVDSKFAELRTDMHKGFADMTRWIVGTVLGVGALSITITTFVLNNATPKAAPASLAPIIIYAQPAAAPSATPLPPGEPAKH
jgi:hypothetical protein